MKQITESAVYQRIKRKLSKDGAELYRVNPNHTDQIDKYGRYYVVTNDGTIKPRITLADFARSIGVLKQHEEIK